MPEFVEKYLGHSRKRLARILDRASINDLPVRLHLIKTESARDLDIDELNENQ